MARLFLLILVFLSFCGIIFLGGITTAIFCNCKEWCGDHYYQRCVNDKCNGYDPDVPGFENCADQCDILGAGTGSSIKPCYDICDAFNAFYDSDHNVEQFMTLSNAGTESYAALVSCTDIEDQNARLECAEEIVRKFMLTRNEVAPAITSQKPGMVDTPKVVKEADSGGLTVFLQTNKEGQYLDYYVADPYKFDITVVDEYQNPVSDAGVTLTFTNMVMGTSTSRTFTTDQTGHFTVSGEISDSLTGSQKIGVTASKKGYSNGYAETYLTVKNLIHPPVLDVSFASDPDAANPLSVTFTARVDPEGVAKSYAWFFDDGSPDADGNLVHHTFPKTGDYNVSLTVEDVEGNIVTYAKMVPVASLTEGTKTSATLYQDYPKDLTEKRRCFEVTIRSLTGTKIPQLSKVTWDFGDGHLSFDEEKPCHVYSEQKNYWVTVSVDFVDGTRNTASTEVIIATDEEIESNANELPESPPVAGFDADPVSGNAPLRVLFMDSSMGSPDEYSWDFGDGSASTAKSPEHTFASPGSYPVTLTVSRTSGEKDALTRTITVTGEGNAVKADFSYALVDEDDPLVIRFTDQSAGEPDTIAWDFGNGGYSTDRNPSVSFSKPGSYEVTLKVTGKSGTDECSKTIGIGSEIPASKSDDGTITQTHTTTPASVPAPREVTEVRDHPAEEPIEQVPDKQKTESDQPTGTEMFKSMFQDQYQSYVNDFALFFTIDPAGGASGTISGHGSIETSTGISTIDGLGQLAGTYDSQTGTIVLSGHTSTQWVPPPPNGGQITADWKFEGTRSGDSFSGTLYTIDEQSTECTTTPHALTAVKVSSRDEAISQVIFVYSGKGCEWESISTAAVHPKTSSDSSLHYTVQKDATNEEGHDRHVLNIRLSPDGRAEGDLVWTFDGTNNYNMKGSAELSGRYDTVSGTFVLDGDGQNYSQQPGKSFEPWAKTTQIHVEGSVSGTTASGHYAASYDNVEATRWDFREEPI